MIGTADALEAVFTRRPYATRRGYEPQPRLSAQIRRPLPANPQLTALQPNQPRPSDKSQVQPLFDRLAGLPIDEALHDDLPPSLDQPLRDWLHGALEDQRGTFGAPAPAWGPDASRRREAIERGCVIVTGATTRTKVRGSGGPTDRLPGRRPCRALPGGSPDGRAAAARQ
jgi:hypothetical protein